MASRLHFALVVPRGSTSESLARRANGTGPFAVAEWQPSSLALQRNRLYWGEAAGVSRVRDDFGITAADPALSRPRCPVAREGLLYEPRADGYLQVAALRSGPAASP